MSDPVLDSRPPEPSSAPRGWVQRRVTPKRLLIFALSLAALAVATVAYVVISALGSGMSMEQLLREYGYWLILGWTFIEGETIVIIAGVAASAGHMNLWTIVLVAWIGSYCGDQLYFTVGKLFGPQLLKKVPAAQKPVDQASRLLRKYDYWFILTFRFIYGVRNVTPPALAIAGVSHKRFAILNFIAAGLWALSFAGAGFLLGEAFKTFVEDAHKYFGFIIVGTFALAIVWGVWHTIKRLIDRRRAYARECAAAKAGGAPAAATANPGAAKHPPQS